MTTTETASALAAAPRLSRRAALLLLAGALSGCSVGTGRLFGGGLETSPGVVDSRRAARMISSYRGSRGLGSVRASGTLDRIAAAQAKAMAKADTLSHRVPGQPAFRQRIAAGGYKASLVAENVGAGYKSLDSAIARWRASPGHDKNLLLPGVTEIGIAVANVPESRYGSYWALVLAAPYTGTASLVR